MVFNLAGDYADINVNNSQYNANALVNKTNQFFIKSDFTISIEIYLEANGIQAYCVQAIYTLGLENARIDLPEEASQAFEKLLTVVSNDIILIYWIANLYEQHT